MKVFRSFMSVLLVGLFAVAGCESPYTPAPQILPTYIKTIYIRPFVNNTNQYGLEEKLTLAVVDEFIRDGRLKIVNSEAEADGVVVGEISKYILQPLTYDANMVTEQYKLWVLLNVHFVDRVKNVTMWTEPNMEGIQVYYDVTRGGPTEVEVQQTMWSNFAIDIVKRTMEGFRLNIQARRKRKCRNKTQ